MIRTRGSKRNERGTIEVLDDELVPDSIGQQVAEQSKVVNEYQQEVAQVVQSISVLESENNAQIKNRDAFDGKTLERLLRGSSAAVPGIGNDGPGPPKK